MKYSLLPALVLAALSAFGTVAVAEIVAMPDGTLFVSDVVDKPGPGTRQTEVLRQFGEPALRHAPVGVPAISSWEYEGFEVYFENGVVIHSVERQASSVTN